MMVGEGCSVVLSDLMGFVIPTVWSWSFLENLLRWSWNHFYGLYLSHSLGLNVEVRFSSRLTTTPASLQMLLISCYSLSTTTQGT